MPKPLKDQIVFITGASSGFGADAAREFARQGCTVVPTARRMDRLAALAGEITSSGGNAFPLAMDVTVPSQVEAAVQAALERFGRIDVLFNNAGFGRLDWLERLDPAADIDAQIAVNLAGVIRVTRRVLPSMLARRSGTIINMSSVAGRIAAPLYTIYAATKYGVRGFTDALRREAAPFGVQVCGIYPGPAPTEFSQHSGENSAREKLRVFDPLYMTSEYVARCVVGLARRPRRSLVIPWWFGPILSFDYHFPGLVDWFLKVAFVGRFHKLDGDQGTADD